jgi:hypothetical protein
MTQEIKHHAQALRADADAGDIDLAAGSHLIRSPSEHMVRHAPCPVLTLRDTVARQKTDSRHGAEPAALGSALGHLGTSRE